MAKYIHEEVQEILDEPFNGHPSREIEHQLKQTKKALIYLAKHLPVGRI